MAPSVWKPLISLPVFLYAFVSVGATGSDPALDADDECSAHSNPEECSLNAMQLRGHILKAAEDPDDNNSATPKVSAVNDDSKPTAESATSGDSPITGDAPSTKASPITITDDAPSGQSGASPAPSAPDAPSDSDKVGQSGASPAPSAPDAPSDSDKVEVKTVDGYDQCGGKDWDGATECKKGYTCYAVDKWYSQCTPTGHPPEPRDEDDESSRRRRRRRRRRRSHHHDDDDDHHSSPHNDENHDKKPVHSSGGDEEDEPAPPKADKPKGDDKPEIVDVLDYQAPLAAQKKNPEMPRDKKTNPIMIKGNFLYDSVTGERFFAKGVAYNPRNMKFSRQMMKHGNCTAGKPEMRQLAYADDPTADHLEHLWSEALNAMANMGANTVRLYNIDPEISHNKFMDYAASLGIYVIVPLTRHDWGFLPAGSPSPKCYEEEIDGYGNVGTNVLVSAKLILKQFSQYDNVVLFTVANEMTVADKNGYAAFPCVKALTRDIHRYQSECGESMRRVPLIYADMDMGPPYREMVGRYLTCELESEDDAVDAYGLNVYSWCDKEFKDENGKANFQYSPYYPITQEFAKFSKPLLFTEFGCNVGEFETFCPYSGGRTWPDVKTFFDEFQEIMSGAVAFEFSMEDNQFGMALTPGFSSDKHNKHNLYYLDNYYALKEEFQKHNVSKKWDGAKATSCDWTPSDAHKLKHERSKSKCPAKGEVSKLFKDKRLDSKPNWAALPPKPKNTDLNALSTCADYKVAPDVYKEGCCHMDCSKVK